MKHCEVISRQEAIFVVGNIGTQPGVRITSMPVTKLPLPVLAEDLGRAVLETLNAYKAGMKHPSPDEIKESEKEILRLAGFSSWRKLCKDSKWIGIHSEGNSVTALPSIAGPAAGYASITELAVTAVAEPHLVGDAILEALSRCMATSRF